MFYKQSRLVLVQTELIKVTICPAGHKIKVYMYEGYIQTNISITFPEYLQKEGYDSEMAAM